MCRQNEPKKHKMCICFLYLHLQKQLHVWCIFLYLEITKGLRKISDSFHSEGILLCREVLKKVFTCWTRTDSPPFTTKWCSHCQSRDTTWLAWLLALQQPYYTKRKTCTAQFENSIKEQESPHFIIVLSEGTSLKEP